MQCKIICLKIRKKTVHNTITSKFLTPKESKNLPSYSCNYSDTVERRKPCEHLSALGYLHSHHSLPRLILHLQLPLHCHPGGLLHEGLFPHNKRRSTEMLNRFYVNLTKFGYLYSANLLICTNANRKL